MHWVTHNNMFGYFGGISDDLYNQGHYDVQRFNHLQEKARKKTGFPLHQLFFPKQIHTAEVVVIENVSNLKTPVHLFHENADAVITKQKNIGIGVVTADCLPIFLYDAKNQAIGVIHAGWRGLAAKIITATIVKMHDQFGTNPNNLRAYLGPSAGVCCYEVQTEFLSHFCATLIEERSGKLFFNPKKTGILELTENNVPVSHIDTSNHTCTICNAHFCSVRRQKEKAGRQPSFIFLH